MDDYEVVGMDDYGAYLPSLDEIRDRAGEIRRRHFANCENGKEQPRYDFHYYRGAMFGPGIRVCQDVFLQHRSRIKEDELGTLPGRYEHLEAVSVKHVEFLEAFFNENLLSID